MQVHALQCDVRDPQAVSTCVDQMETLTGLPDVRTPTSRSDVWAESDDITLLACDGCR